MSTPSTTTIERPDVHTDETTHDDTPKVFHYVKKNEIIESAIHGKMVVALCGEVFSVKKKARPGSPVCPACQEIHATLRR